MLSATYKTNPQAFIEISDILKALAHPQRLCIMKTLCEKDRVNVTDMQTCLGGAQSTLSQHLARLKAAKLITADRKGTSVYYLISDQRIKSLVQLIFNEFYPNNK
ncbi:MAG: transcriptional regulator [Clostridia bacterium]|nr:transcriptional regulator [Clostridia bacterium]